MPAASGPGFSGGGPRVFPNGFRTGRAETTPVPPPVTPPVWLHRTDYIAENRTTSDVDNTTSLIVNNTRTVDADNRRTYVYQA
jgi:hypothetical protein